MSMEPPGVYQVLVVHLQPSAGGSWSVTVDGTAPAQVFALAPGVFTIRFWISPDRSFIRGTIRREGDPRQVPFQSGGEIGALLSAWLAGATATPDGV